MRNNKNVKKKIQKTNLWLKHHVNDKYVKQAKKHGLRSRAWFKLHEIQQSDKLFHVGTNVLDLGATPGSWSQYALTQIGKKDIIFACDILPMKPIDRVYFLQGDLRELNTQNMLLKQINKQKIQVILSDMAPNMSGISIIDISNSIYLIELSLNICHQILVPNGSFLVKFFQGKGIDECLDKIYSMFAKIKIRKPKASKIHSREMYIVATGYKV